MSGETMRPVEAERLVEAAGTGSVEELLGHEPCRAWCTLEHHQLYAGGWTLAAEGPLLEHSVGIESPHGTSVIVSTMEDHTRRVAQPRVDVEVDGSFDPDAARSLGEALLRAAAAAERAAQAG